MSIDAVLGKSGCQTGCFYALLNWFRSPTGACAVTEDYILSCILSLYGRVPQRASLSIPQLQAAYPGPPHLPYLSPCILHLMRACTAVTRLASLRAASPRSPVPSHPPPGQQRIHIPVSYLQPASPSVLHSVLVPRELIAPALSQSPASPH